MTMENLNYSALMNCMTNQIVEKNNQKAQKPLQKVHATGFICTYCIETLGILAILIESLNDEYRLPINFIKLTTPFQPTHLLFLTVYCIIFLCNNDCLLCHMKERV